MKKLVWATLVAAFAASVSTSAAVSSLPIGSVEKVLDYELPHTDKLVLNIQSSDSVQDIQNWNVSFLFMDAWTNYVKADGTTESINALCQRAAGTSDKSELKALLQTMMREAVRVSVDPNDPKLQGKTVAVIIGGSYYPDPGYEWNGTPQSLSTFSVENYFVLGALKDSQGNTVIPESAYGVDMNQSITNLINQTFFIPGIASGKIKDGQGNVIDQVFIPYWLPNVMEIRNNRALLGERGVVELRYTDGTSQTFSLVDGSLLSPLPTLSIAPVVAEATSALSSVPGPRVKLTVNSSPGTVTVEWSNDLKTWKSLTVVTNTTGSVSVTDAVSAPARFYRARLGN